jgi:hypothetical protein
MEKAAAAMDDEETPPPPPAPAPAPPSLADAMDSFGATDAPSTSESTAGQSELMSSLDRGEAQEIVKALAADKDPLRAIAVLAESRNDAGAAEAIGALWRENASRAAEVLMGLETARGAELLRILCETLGEVDAATALVAMEEPGRANGVAQFILPYGARSVVYKGKELLAAIASTSPSAAKKIYAGLLPTEQVSILRRACLGMGQRPGSEDKETRTALVARDDGGAPDPSLAALLLSGLTEQAAVEVVHRFKTRGVKNGSEKWQRRQTAAAEVMDALGEINPGFAAGCNDALAKKR